MSVYFKCLDCGCFIHRKPSQGVGRCRKCYVKSCQVKPNVDNGQKRHKCSACGRVRNEDKMKQWTSRGYRGDAVPLVTRFGHVCWLCADSPDCDNKVKFDRPY